LKYRKGQVGIKRHPELYTQEEKRVFDTVKEELALWRAAEKIHKKTEKFTDMQLMFIVHYVLCLRGLSDYEMINLHNIMQVKTIESRTNQKILDLLGCSARQLAERESTGE